MWKKNIFRRLQYLRSIILPRIFISSRRKCPIISLDASLGLVCIM